LIERFGGLFGIRLWPVSASSADAPVAGHAQANGDDLRRAFRSNQTTSTVQLIWKSRAVDSFWSSPKPALRQLTSNIVSICSAKIPSPIDVCASASRTTFRHLVSDESSRAPLLSDQENVHEPMLEQWRDAHGKRNKTCPAKLRSGLRATGNDCWNFVIVDSRNHRRNHYADWNSGARSCATASRTRGGRGRSRLRRIRWSPGSSVGHRKINRHRLVPRQFR